MKKIIFILTFFLFGILKIKALTYSQWSDTFPSEVSKMLIESEERYKWYKEKRINEEYLLLNEGTQKYIDLEDTIKSEAKVSFKKPEEIKGRNIDLGFGKMYFTKEDVTHINFSILDKVKDFYISEIEIYNIENNNLIKYEIEDKNFYYLNDGNNEEYKLFGIDDCLILDLKNNYNINNIEVKIIYKYLKGEDINIKVSFSTLYTYALESVEKKLQFCENNCSLTYNVKNSKENYPFLVTRYIYTDTLYKKYDIERIYSDDYYAELEGYIKDESSGKTFYRYILDKYVIVNGYNEIVKDSNYCKKSFCMIKYIEENIPIDEVNIKNPQTNDNIYKNIFIFLFSIIFILFNRKVYLLMSKHYKK